MASPNAHFPGSGFKNIVLIANYKSVHFVALPVFLTTFVSNSCLLNFTLINSIVP